jgi:hypothetical protein
MGLPESYEFGDVLDMIFKTLLENLKAIHAANVVHRDCEYKPRTFYMLSSNT